jgi:Fe-S-cluster-containing dehydrogenase component
MRVQVDRCIGCGLCFDACKTENDVLRSFFVPKLCNQCDNPPCVQVCPVGATYKTPDGVILVDSD